MYDYVFQFARERDAQTDPIVGKYYVMPEDGAAAWRGDCVVPNLFMWDPNQTEHGTTPDGAPYEKRVPYDALWRLLIATAEKDLELGRHDSCVVIADRTTGDVLLNAIPPTVRVEPLYLGSQYDSARARGPTFRKARP